MNVVKYYEGLNNYLIENDNELEFESQNVYYEIQQLEENKVNVADLITIKDTKYSTYFVESVIQL